MGETARLLIASPDDTGLIAAVSGFIADHGGNIVDADQHTDIEAGKFFMRVEVEAAGFGLTAEEFGAAWSPVADRHSMRWRVRWTGTRSRVAILVGREGHCLADLLWRWRTGELDADIPLVASNHPDLSGFVEPHGIPYHHLPVMPGKRDSQEAHLASLLDEARIDLVVLARYMQVLGPELVGRWQHRMINIHHGFLPAFAGGRPYHQAHERGVKLIGATGHYVTEDLDQGPIIAQATTTVRHHDTVEDMVRKGRDLERVVLAEAVRLHLEDRILVSGNRTVVFE